MAWRTSARPSRAKTVSIGGNAMAWVGQVFAQVVQPTM